MPNVPHREPLESEVVFQSFHHSQGDYTLQAFELIFARKVHGVELDMTLPDHRAKRIANYIGSHRDKPQHVIVTTEDENNLTAARVGFKRFTENMDRLFAIHQDRPPSVLPHDIGAMIIRRESLTMSDILPWTNAEQQDKGRAARIAARVAAGQTSFLYHYGRDQQPTGLDVFDDMYRLVWSSIASNLENRPKFQAALNEHARVIAAAEATHTK